jgi:cellulose synthase/poly-beta-1,6-N-acetylglucosamine synthase-like glycosyltransferase
MTNVPARLDGLCRQRRRWARNLIRHRIFKHGDVFHPGQGNWRLANVLSSFDSVFFHVVLAFTSIFYLLDMVLHYPSVLPYILVANYLLYLTAEMFEVAVVIGVTERRAVDGCSLPFLPLFNLYKRLLKWVRAAGYLEELLFQRSYADPFAPAKVRRRMARW